MKIQAIIKQNKPENATVVNFGVSFLHLKLTESIEKPIDEVIPKIKPIKDALPEFPTDIIIIPIVATIIDIQTLIESLSLKNKKPSKAVKKGIAARHNKVIAALVFVIE